MNHSSPAYTALNRNISGDHSGLRYYEVKHAQHSDALLGLPALKGRFVPLQFYLEQALDRMLAHLSEGAPLPPSQVVRTEPATFTGASLPELRVDPGAKAIIQQAGVLRIP